jgi:hypothetical protein
MLCVTCNSYMLCIVMVNVVMLSVVMLSVVMLSVEAAVKIHYAECRCAFSRGAPKKVIGLIMFRRTWACC